jgi:DNA-binding SARP family transcriptional activator
MTFRVYLAGSITVEADDAVVRDSAFGGHQLRLLFAYLVCADGRPVPKAELAELLWPEGPPQSWEISLAALVSKLRSLLAKGAVPREAIDGALGTYHLRLPSDTWVDVSAVGANVYQAEGAMLRGEPRAALPHALIASAITRRVFLPEDSGAWVERKRAELTEQRLRALELLAEALLADGDHARAANAAADVLDLDQYRETGYQLLMKAHAAAGNRAEALRVYERCRRLLAAELGVDPSRATEQVYLDILRS